MAIKKIDKDTEITIANNTKGAFFYSNKNASLIINLNEYGDEDSISFSELKTILGDKRMILTDLILIITDVVDEECTIEDIVKALKLSDSYNEYLSLTNEKLGEVEHIDIRGVEEFVQDATAEEIGKILGNKKSKVRYAIAETAADLYKNKELSDWNKMKAVAEKLGHSDISSFWKDIESSNR